MTRIFIIMKTELVVAESVIVVTRLLQTCSEERQKSVIMLAKLLDTIKVPKARANIMWLIGQHAATLPQVGPDVLRQAAKTFTEEVNDDDDASDDIHFSRQLHD